MHKFEVDDVMAQAEKAGANIVKPGSSSSLGGRGFRFSVLSTNIER